MNPNSSTSEQEWIGRLKAGEDQAYAWLFDQYYDLLCRMACVWLNGDRYTAQTVVGDVVFRLWSRREEWTIERSLRGYLIRSVRNGCLNLLGSAPYTKQVPLPDPEVLEQRAKDLEPPVTPYGVLIEQELEQQITDALNTLPEKTRQVFIKCRIEQLSYAQAAQELGISIHTVKYHIGSAIKLLHEQLKGLWAL